ncbi:MAG: hypothetical protein Q9222_004560 [Ikaeria aurantiellina]
MPSELDPLLPQNEPAPEISGNGSHKPVQRSRDRNIIIQEARDDGASDSDLSSSETGSSALRTTLGIFATVVGLGLLMAWLSSSGFHQGQRPSTTPIAPSRNLSARVDTILSKNPLIDGHNDLAFLIRYKYGNRIHEPAFTDKFENGDLEGQVDLQRLRAGKVGGTFWSAFVLCPANRTDFSDENYAHAVSATLSQIDLLRRLTAAYPKVFSSSDLNASSAADAFDIHRLLISPIGIEGLHQLGNSFSNLRLYYSLGVRYATLTWNCHNAFADAAIIINGSGQTVASSPFWGGISEAGQTVVQEMNRLGMLVDLSHVSKDTMIDVLGGRAEKWAGSKAPVIFSHSSAFRLCPHPRNVADDVLELVRSTNSLVMVNFSPDFISCVPSDSSTGLPDYYPRNATLHQVARHIKYIGETIGFDHVGIGSDFDGIPETPAGLEDVSKYPALIRELLQMGVTDDDAAKLVGRNVLRVWRDVDAVASEMRANGVLPAEDVVKEL